MFGRDVSGDVLAVLAGLAIMIGYGTMWWRILSKTGYPGALGLVMFIPLVNLVLLVHLAIADWPIEKRVERLRQESEQE